MQHSDRSGDVGVRRLPDLHPNHSANQNTRNWARAALSRKSGKDFAQDKRAWAEWWRMQGHPAVPEELLEPRQATPPTRVPGGA